MTPTMMALRAHRRGGPEQLVYESVPRPDPAAGEVLVAVHAAAITFAELTWDATWTTDDGVDRTPTTPSHEFSGVVAEVGAGGEQFTPGDEVYGLVPFDRNGAAAEFVVVPTSHLVTKPGSLRHVPAAALSLAGLTAWQAVVDRADVQPGDEVLVHGGTGGVGSFAVQLAAACGARVTATHRGADAAFLRELGATVAIDLSSGPWGADERSYDVVIDTVGGETLAGSFPLLRDGGRLVTLSAPPPQEQVEQARGRGIRAEFFLVSADTEELAELARRAAAGELRTAVAREFPLELGGQAFRFGSVAGRRPGKVVLVVRD